MSEKVKFKLQQLIRDLEGLTPVAGVPAAATDAEADAGHSPAEAESSSYSLGLSDLTKTDSSTNDVSAAGSDTTPGTRHHQPFPAAGSSGVRRHVAELEGKVLELLLERKALDARHARELSLRDAELERLQQYINEELADLQERQAQVEAAAPDVRLQLQEARAALRDLIVSEQMYRQLKQVPDDRLLLPDAVRIAVYEALQELLLDNEQLRLAAASARETAVRHEAELNRLQRESARLAAAVADKEADIATTLDSLESRNARLAAELEEASISLELSKGKVASYDALAAKAERLEAEVARLTGAEAAAERLRSQLSAADAAVSDKDSTLAMLLSDKAYLTKEVQVAEERLAQLSARLNQAEGKVSQLKAERQELYQKLAGAAEQARSQDEGRWEREVARLQAAAAADLEQIRKQAADTAEREARMLRELRDAALDEASRTKSELRQLRQAHEDLLLSSREAAARADVVQGELMADLKMKQFEATRLQALSDERGEAVEKLKLQVELLTDKVQLLMAELNQLEQDGRLVTQDLQQQLDTTKALLREYQAADGVLDTAISSAATAVFAGSSAMAGLEQQLEALMSPAVRSAAAASSGSQAGASGQQQQQQQEKLSGALQRRIQHNIQLAARCARLEAEKQQLARDKQEVAGKLTQAQATVEKLHGQLQLVGQPHSYLLQQLQAAEAAANRAEQQLAEAQAALNLKQQQADEAAAERAALRRDLSKILQERGTLDSMRRLVAAAVSSAAAAAAAGIGGHQPVAAAVPAGVGHYQPSTQRQQQQPPALVMSGGSGS